MTNEVCPDIGPLSVAGSDFKQVEITEGYCGRVAVFASVFTGKI